MPTSTELRWHATGLSTFQTCPERFRRRYLDGEHEEKASASSLIGLALHHAAQLGVEAAMEGQQAELQFLRDNAEAHFDGLVKADAEGPDPIPWDEDPGSLERRKSDLRSLVLLWNTRLPGLFREYGLPVMAENHFETKLWGHTVTGQIDMATDQDIIIDWKSGLKYLTDKRAEREMQRFVYPAAYEALTGRFPPKLVFVQMVRLEPTRSRDWTYKLNVQAQPTHPAQKELLHRLLDDDQAQVDAGVFPLNISSGLCSPDWCPFWTTCPASLVKVGEEGP